MTTILRGSDPWAKGQSCGRNQCWPCQGPEKQRGRCDAAQVTNRIDCQDCKEKGVKASYWGETAASAAVRSSWHLSSMASMAEDSALLKHTISHHQGIHPRYLYIILESFKSAMKHQITESVHIDTAQVDILMNSKAEFHQPAVTRIITTREVADRSAGR